MPQHFPDPHQKQSSTPQERRKFWVLVVCAGIVVVLFWIATMPWILREEDAGPGPRGFFQKIGEMFSFADIIFNKTNEAQDAITDSQ